MRGTTDTSLHRHSRTRSQTIQACQSDRWRSRQSAEKTTKLVTYHENTEPSSFQLTFMHQVICFVSACIITYSFYISFLCVLSHHELYYFK